jgi:hypothetical protein
MSIGEFSMSEASLAEQPKAQDSKPAPKRIYTAKPDRPTAPEAR